MLTAFLLIVSLATLFIAFSVWRETSSKQALMNGIFASLALLIGARLAVEGQQPDMAVGLPLLAGMLLLGRGVGTWFRSKKEPFLQQPALMWLGAGSACLIGAFAVYQTFAQA